jgi:hypothetical protein
MPDRRHGSEKCATGDIEFASMNERGRQLTRPYFFRGGTSLMSFKDREAP